MPLNPDLGGQSYESFKREFAEKIIATWARYCPNMRAENIIGQYVYTAREYTAELVNMRDGDIFMGAFNAEQVMYNHFGYRTPVKNLYMAGSPCHPGGAVSGGAGYIAAGIIARDLDIAPWWRPWDARVALQSLAQAAA
jgi:phytoene dehydrogenase-like protein